MYHKFPEYSYKGYKTTFEEDIEYGEEGPENVKIFHFVKPPDGGKEIHMDWSPYKIPTFEQFKLWIDVGCPDRFNKALWERQCFFPLDEKDLLRIRNQRFHDGAIHSWLAEQGYRGA